MGNVGLKVVFRADSSPQIGNGHVMRCLTLADAVTEQGGTALFICRAHPQHLGPHILARGHSVEILPAADPVAGDTAHAAWLGGTWTEDAAQTAAVLAGRAVDWLIVDHYALDAKWQAAVRPKGAKIMVLDDLADRPHECSLLFDQNLGRIASDYDRLVPADVRRMIGPEVALLRPAFAALRTQSIARRAASRGRLVHLLIAMGGTDADNATGAVLRTLETNAILDGVKVTVVLGGNAPHLTAVRDQAKALPYAVTVCCDVADMASLMADADLAIGGTGGTSWERCCLGLPTLLVVLADNQALGAAALAKAGAGILCGDLRKSGWQEALLCGLAECRQPGLMMQMTSKAAAICDGFGAGRVVSALMELGE